MKNILRYFYQIVINDNDIDDDGYFFYNKIYFQLKLYTRSSEEIGNLIMLNNYMIINNIKVNQIILNTNNEALSLYEEKYYILIKINYYDEDLSKFSNILAPNYKNMDILKRNNWSYLWSMKVDYIEYQMEHLIHKYPYMYSTMNYYIGLAENAIMYYNMLSLRDEKLYIGHRRINNKLSLYDPMELVIDYKMRDLAEYVKKMFFVKRQSIITIVNYLSSIKLENIDYVLLYTRLLFPSYYFDMCDNIVNEKILENNLYSITKLASEYEELLNNIFLIIKERINIIDVSWLNK